MLGPRFYDDDCLLVGSLSAWDQSASVDGWVGIYDGFDGFGEEG